jgi:hypothetical protein
MPRKQRFKPSRKPRPVETTTPQQARNPLDEPARNGNEPREITSSGQVHARSETPAVLDEASADGR